MSRALDVFYERRRVGVLTQDESGRMAFAYAGTWLGAGERFPISMSLPLQPETHRELAHAFFDNLLPEGATRARVAADLGVSADNSFALLRRLGGDCAGALWIGEGEPPATTSELVPLTATQLQKAIDQRSLFSLQVDTRRARLSLAGAQDKLPVIARDDQILLPIGGTPTTHILKPPSDRFRNLPLNELFCLELARAVKLPVVSARLQRIGRSTSLIVDRYDRDTATDPPRRLHQEDLCQVLGRGAWRKYEHEGGPRLADCVRALRDYSDEPLADTRRLLAWQVFNVLSGNSDGHAKNLSLLHRPERSALAPFYDLVCTRAYPRLERRLAMSIGGESDPGWIAARHWRSLAVELGIRAATLLEIVDSMATEIWPAAQRVAADRFTPDQVSRLHPVLQLIRRQARRTRRLLVHPR